MDVALTLAFPEPRSVLEEDAPEEEVEPRGGSLPWVAWNLDNVVFIGAVVESWLRARSMPAGVGVVEGDMKATFFCTSEEGEATAVAVTVFREELESESRRGEVGRSWSSLYGGVGVSGACEAWSIVREGSWVGRGDEETTSGSGLNELYDVAVARLDSKAFTIFATSPPRPPLLPPLVSLPFVPLSSLPPPRCKRLSQARIALSSRGNVGKDGKKGENTCFQIQWVQWKQVLTPVERSLQTTINRFTCRKYTGLR